MNIERLLQNTKILLEPFPHVIINNFFEEHEYNLILKELYFFFESDKFLEPGRHHAFGTESKALCLEKVYTNPEFSNILTHTKKTTNVDLVNYICDNISSFAQLPIINSWSTKVRYYHDKEGYIPHKDLHYSFLTFWYHHKEPKKFQGGELYFPSYNDYTVDCSNNKLIMIPSYVEHAVREVHIENEDYYNGSGRFCISQFLKIVTN